MTFIGAAPVDAQTYRKIGLDGQLHRQRLAIFIFEKRRIRPHAQSVSILGQKQGRVVDVLADVYKHVLVVGLDASRAKRMGTDPHQLEPETEVGRAGLKHTRRPQGQANLRDVNWLVAGALRAPDSRSGVPAAAIDWQRKHRCRRRRRQTTRGAKQFPNGQQQILLHLSAKFFRSRIFSDQQSLALNACSEFAHAPRLLHIQVEQSHYSVPKIEEYSDVPWM